MVFARTASQTQSCADQVGTCAMSGVRAVFFDRDGVLNRAIVKEGIPHPPIDLIEFEIFADAPEALRVLRNAGFLLIGVTNQPDVARGIQTRAMVETINAALCARLPLNEIRACYHDDADQCDCRKPAPGLLLQAAQAHGIDLASSFVIGDRWKDIEAGRRAGCKTVLIDRGYTEKWQGEPPAAHVESLAQATEWILLQSDPERGEDEDVI